jgi:ornithine cyclodeaminase/alanine dehydrogenase-like protein (mu-crystallin family)
MFEEVSEEAVKSLNPELVIEAIESAFRVRYLTTIVPARTQVPIADGLFLVMPCYSQSGNTLGIKFITSLNHPPRPEDRVQATYILFDPITAQPLKLIPATYLTGLRTAATSAVATRHLAREDAKTLGIFGIGRQARAHLDVVRHTRRFENFVVCGKELTRTRQFAMAVSAELNVRVEAVDRVTCAQSDVLCTCTTSATPLFDGHNLKPGTHLNVIGAFQPDTREVDTDTIRRSRVVVETYDAVMTTAGDVLIPLKEGAIGRGHILSDLHELVSGKKKVRRSPEEITVFKGVGCALEDLVTAELVEKFVPAS